MKSHKFVDLVTVYARAGNGGSGSMSFRREKFVPNGGPDGGDGGRGGHIILQANRDVASLIHLYYTPHQTAKDGGPGRGKQSHGANGKDLIIPVPCGTEVRDKDTDVMLGDLVKHDETLTVTHGGKGGLGNVHWKSATHQAPTEHTEGIPGETITLQLELKLVADIGLVGFPNAGKSSLLTRISDAHPKIAPYPFTTMNPIIGTMIFEDYTRQTVADIPGLIEGAHAGVGLGHQFLRHIERARYLVYVIDMAGVDGRAPWEDYASLKNELSLHRQGLAERPSLVVANKMDLDESQHNLTSFTEQTDVTPVRISAETGEGVQDLRLSLHKLCAEDD